MLGMLKVFVLCGGAAVVADLLPRLQGPAETIVVVGAACGVVMQAWRKVVRPLVRGFESLVDLAQTAERRLEVLEDGVARLSSMIDLARDEHVADVRDLLRRGELPQPPLMERRHRRD